MLKTLLGRAHTIGIGDIFQIEKGFCVVRRGLGNSPSGTGNFLIRLPQRITLISSYPLYGILGDIKERVRQDQQQS